MVNPDSRDFSKILLKWYQFVHQIKYLKKTLDRLKKGMLIFGTILQDSLTECVDRIKFIMIEEGSDVS